MLKKILLSYSLTIAFILATFACSSTDPKNPNPAAPASTPLPAPTKTYNQLLPATPIAAIIPTTVLKETGSADKKGKGQNKYFPVPTPEPTQTLVAEFPLTVIDRNGEDIVFTQPPERIVAYDAAAVETIFKIGQGHRIIGTHSWVSYPAEVANIEKVGDAFNMNIERIVALEPDLVFLFYPTFKEELEKAGLKVLLLESVDDNLMKMANTFRIWGQITGSPNEAESLAKNFENRVGKIESVLSSYHSGPSVFQDVGDLWTPGSNTLMGNVFNLLKLQNIANDVDNYGQLSPEVIIDRNPQFIISSNPELIYTNPAFQNLLPVKNKSVFKANDDYLGISGPRFILGVEDLAFEFYPGLFK